MTPDNERQKISAGNRLGLHYSAFRPCAASHPSQINHLQRAKLAFPVESAKMGYLRWKPWSGYLMLFFAAMGLLYGIADVAEDWKLKAILDPAAPVDADDANVAKWLTRAKLVTITLSGIGVATFELLQLVAKALR